MRVTAIISNYNGGRFLAEALDSVLSQDPRPDQVLVADDGSTDDSLRAFEPFRGRAEWVGVPHGGQAPALNAALAKATGDWVAFLESDDVWRPGKLAALAAAAADTGVSAVQHGMEQVDAALKPLPTWRLPEDARFTLDDYLEGRVKFAGLSALSVRRDVLTRIGAFPADLVTNVDVYLQPRVLAEGAMVHLAAGLGLRRIHGANFVGGMRSDPARLEAFLKLCAVVYGHNDAFLKERGLTLSEAHARMRRGELAELELLLARRRGDWGGALRGWRKGVAACGARPYAAFKAAALGAALLSPALYVALYEGYAANPLLARWRKRLLY